MTFWCMMSSYQLFHFWFVLLLDGIEIKYPLMSLTSEILHNLRDEYRVFVRWSKGQDINAGCGQLAGRKT